MLAAGQFIDGVDGQKYITGSAQPHRPTKVFVAERYTAGGLLRLASGDRQLAPSPEEKRADSFTSVNQLQFR